MSSVCCCRVCSSVSRATSVSSDVEATSSFSMMTPAAAGPAAYDEEEKEWRRKKKQCRHLHAEEPTTVHKPAGI
jgi:hypothetical protein